MFVFPAFDSNYKTRKRTFKCCQNCRVKRVKCEITSTDYESVGCSNCRKHKWECSLIKPGARRPSEPSQPQQSMLITPNPTNELSSVRSTNGLSSVPRIEPGTTENSSSAESSEESFQPQSQNITNHQQYINEEAAYNIPKAASLPELMVSSARPARVSQNAFSSAQKRMDMKRITPQYLKQTYNFNVAGQDSGSNYQYLFHGHPKVIIAMSDDQTIWHESGVYVKTREDDEGTKEGVEKKPFKLRNFGTGTYKEFYIRNESIYNFLLSINAFTLAGPAYPFDADDTRQLIELYFYKLNSIFPLVHEKGFWDDFHNNKAQNVMIYVVVLAIARDKMAESILKRVFLKGSEYRHGHQMTSMTQEQFQEDLIAFMTELEYKIRQIILILPQLGDEDKFTRLVVSLVLSLHFNYDKLGCEKSSHDLTDAINLATSIGIHMKRLSLNADASKVEYSTDLWWCCYIFDRFNGLVNARPVFIRQEDFNVDLPYHNINLLKMVQLARSLENMFFAIFQPFNNNNVIGTNNLNNNMVRYKMFDTDEFQRIEFELCEKERGRNRITYDTMYSVGSRVSDTPFTDYVGNTIHFITRVVNNVVILASQKAKYDNPQIPNHIPEAVALRASSNILWYLVQMKDEFVINIPMIPWCMSLAMAVALKKKARMCLKDGEYEEYKQYQDPFAFEDYINELEKFSSTWWVVDEICRLTRDFADTLNTKAKTKKRRAKSHGVGTSHKHGHNANLKKFKADHNPEWPSIGEVTSSSSAQNGTSNGLVSSPVPKSEAIPSIKNMLQPPAQTSAELNAYIASTNGVHGIATPYMATDSSFSPTSMNSSDANQYDQYFESMQIDIFNNDFFKDVPNVINLLK
ncbi:uncharacterized protein RJT20DRAFT_128748 [Scheffersomyces xylosifermentans]|uniref:uncharacterized protein n=1 Tax=Scheffersomyces xylosifermentans TaxID=1304137 RepID=UPI00315C6B74